MSLLLVEDKAMEDMIHRGKMLPNQTMLNMLEPDRRAKVGAQDIKRRE